MALSGFPVKKPQIEYSAEETEKLKVLLNEPVLNISPVMQCIRAGANANNLKNDKGNSLLHILQAYLAPNTYDIKNAYDTLIRDFNLDPEIKDANGRTPLQCLIRRFFYPVDINFMLDYSDPDTLDDEGNSILAFLCKYNESGRFTPIVQKLHRKNAKFIIANACSIDASKLELNTCIDLGEFARVFSGKKEEQKVAVKIVNIPPTKLCRRLHYYYQEVSVMNALINKENICQMLGYNAENYYIVLEYFNLGSLFNYILKHSGYPLSWPERYEIAQGSLNGVKCIIDAGFFHRDIKSANILLKIINNHWYPCIADFGLAVRKTQENPGEAGTAYYMAPEILKKAKSDEKSEMFSLGKVFVELAFWEHTPAIWPKVKNRQELFELVSSDKRPDLPKDTPLRFAFLIKSCWQTDPAKRPTANQAKLEMEGDMNTLPERLTLKLNG